MRWYPDNVSGDRAEVDHDVREDQGIKGVEDLLVSAEPRLKSHIIFLASFKNLQLSQTSKNQETSTQLSPYQYLPIDQSLLPPYSRLCFHLYPH